MAEQPEQKFENPYAFIPIDFGDYYGSSYILNVTLRAIGNAQPVAIELIGFLGMGKTSLLRYLLNPGVIERHTDFYQPPYETEPYLIFPIFVDFPAKPNTIHPIQYIYQSFLDAYGRYLNYIKRRYSDKLSLNEINFDSSFEPATAEDLVNLIKKTSY